MIPRLYSESETNFNSNGICALSESVSAIVTEEANSIFTLELEYPIHGAWFSEIKRSRLIKALPNVGDEEHIFRIKEIVKSTNPKMVRIYASTKSEDLNGHIIKEFDRDDTAANVVLSSLPASIYPPTNYLFHTDITTKVSPYWFMRNVTNSIIGSEGSLVDLLGGGELKRNNDSLYLYRRRGRDNVTRVTPRKNLRGLEITESTKGLITRIQPYMILQDPETYEDIIVIGDVVSSQFADNYPNQSVVPMDFSGYELENKTQLDQLAALYFTTMNPGCDTPKVTLKVDLINIHDSSEYTKFKDFETVKLFDTVTVYVPRYDVDVLVKIVSVTFDVLREKVIKITAGQPSSTFVQDLNKTYNDKLSNVAETLKKDINTVMMSADGKNKVFTGPNEPDISISSKGDTWFKELGSGEMELYIFDGAYWQVVINANTSKEILDKIDQAEADIAQNIIDIDAALDKATQAELDAGFSKDLAEEAKALGVSASSLAGEAKTNANTAMADAQEAIRQVLLNEGVVEDASADATEAKRLSSLAEANAQEAKTNANTAISDAEEAMRQVGLNGAEATEAKRLAGLAEGNAQEALTKANASVTDATKAFNKSFKSSAVAYAKSTNGSTPPTTGWGPTVPSPSPDVYIWTRTTIVLNDDTPVESYSVGKIGAKGDPGLQGATGGQGIQGVPGAKGDKGLKGDAGSQGIQGNQGVPGANAPTIKSVVQQFYLSTSKTSQTGGSWLSTVPVWGSGKYYWVRVLTTYSNNATSTSTPVLDNALNDSLVTALEVKTANQTLSTTVTQHATLIESKANSSTVDSLTGRVSTAEGSISTIAGQVALKASKSDVNSLTGRVTTAEGTITAQAGQIALRATTATVNALTGRVSAAEASITVQSGKIDLAATKTELTTAIKGIEIGGRNLLLDTDKVFTNPPSPGNMVEFIALPYNLTPIFEENGIDSEYTISFDLKSYDTANTNIISVYPFPDAPPVNKYTFPYVSFTVTEEYKRYSMTFIPQKGDLTKDKTRIVFYGQYKTGNIPFIRRVKIEKGNKATDWSPAPEDVESAISTVQANLTVEADKIASKVSQTDFNTLNGRVGTAESTITQHAASIALRATKTDLDAAKGRLDKAEATITVQAGQIDLRATKTSVDTLTGRVTTAEGSITTQAGQIALRATTATVNALTGRVSTAEGKITVAEGKVTTLTTKTDGHTTQIGTLVSSYNGLSSTVTALETGKVGTVAFSALEQNLSGFKTTVQNTYADKTTVTQLATQWTTTTNLVNGHTSQIASLGTDINLRATKTEVAGSLGAVNLITNGGNIQSTAGWYGPVGLTKHPYYKNNTANLLYLQTAGYTEIYTSGEYFNIEPNTEYTLTFYGFASSNVSGMDLHFLSKKNTSSNTYDNTRLLVHTNLSGSHLDSRSVTFTTNATDNQAYIRFDNNGSTNGISSGVYIADITLVKGSVAPSEWFESTADSIVSQINISPESILLSSKMIQIKGDTYIESGVIKNSHIDNLVADKITAGTLNAANVNIINLNVANLTGNRTQFVESAWNTINGNLHVNAERLTYTYNDGTYLWLSKDGISYWQGSTSYYTNFLSDVFVITGLNHDFASGPLWYQLPPIYRGKQFKCSVVLTDAYGIVTAPDYSSLAINRIVCTIDRPKIDYAGGWIPVIGYSRSINIKTGELKYHPIQVTLIVQY